jgi:hypothetical protein
VKDAQDISVWFSTDQLGKAANMFNAFQENFGFNAEGNYCAYVWQFWRR